MRRGGLPTVLFARLEGDVGGRADVLSGISEAPASAEGPLVLAAGQIKRSAMSAGYEAVHADQAASISDLHAPKFKKVRRS